MKKLLLTLLIIGLLTPLIAGATLYQYYQEQGQNLPSIKERMPLALEAGIENYNGSASQNRLLEAYLRGSSEQFGSALPIAGSTYNLAGSGITGSATSITLQSLTIKQTGYKILDSDLSDTFYITLEPGNNRKQEIASCTTVVQNANGTATLSGCSRGLLPYSPYTASSTYAFTHGGGSQVIFSDPPQLFNTYPAKSNDETITGTWIYNSFPQYVSSTVLPTLNSQFVTKYYADNVGAQGTTAANVSTTRGIEVYGTAPETFGVKVSSTQGTKYLSDGSVGVNYNTSTIYSDANGLGVDTAKDFTFTGSVNLNGTTTLGTTTISDLSVVNSISSNLYINGSFYAMSLSGSTSSDSLKQSADNSTSSLSASKIKVKEIQTFLKGTIRVKFTMSAQAGGGGAGGRIYKNGAAYGTEQYVPAGGGPTTFSEDLSFIPGDLIQLYINNNGSFLTTVNNFRLYYDNIAVSSTSIILN